MMKKNADLIKKRQVYNMSISTFQEPIQKKTSFGGSGVSSILIPADLMKRFQNCQKRYGGKRQYFNHLILRYRVILRTFANDSNGMTTEYQFKNQSLKKVSFRPLPEDWAEMGIFSIASGKSRCFLFVMLLMMDKNGWGTMLKRAGIVMNDPFSDESDWELISIVGLDRNAKEFIRGFKPRLKPNS